jgi:hypothetical protein
MDCRGNIDHIRCGPTEEETRRRDAAGRKFVDRLVKEIQQQLEADSMSVRCKFVCSFKEGQSVHFSPVYSGSEENKKFFQATPGGQIAFYTVNQAALDQFEQGKEYYVDFTPAEGETEKSQSAGA